VTSKPKGTLIIIGGHEEKEGDQAILSEVASHARKGKGRLVVVTVASRVPEELSTEYRSIFEGLGLKQVDVVDIRTRDEAHDPERIQAIQEASVIFFTGGDQLRITSQVGDSPLFHSLRDHYYRGGTIAGTSAGAAAMPETMIVGGPSDESNRISALRMAAGLGLIGGVTIDSHFAQRGRIGRLLGVVAQNPRNLGIGIDEDTAIVVSDSEQFRVVGSGAVYVADGSDISYSSLSEEQAEGIVSIYDVRLHVLGADDSFDLAERRPNKPQEEREETSKR
jgi:cyanophycinase